MSSLQDIDAEAADMPDLAAGEPAGSDGEDERDQAPADADGTKKGKKKKHRKNKKKNSSKQAVSHDEAAGSSSGPPGSIVDTFRRARTVPVCDFSGGIEAYNASYQRLTDKHVFWLFVCTVVGEPFTEDGQHNLPVQDMEGQFCTLLLYDTIDIAAFTMHCTVFVPCAFKRPELDVITIYIHSQRMPFVRVVQNTLHKILLVAASYLNPSTRCWGCETGDGALSCSTCLIGKYCSKLCQANNLPEHRGQCKCELPFAVCFTRSNVGLLSVDQACLRAGGVQEMRGHRSQ